VSEKDGGVQPCASDEGLNLTRSQLAGRASKMNNRTKAGAAQLSNPVQLPRSSKAHGYNPRTYAPVYPYQVISWCFSSLCFHKCNLYRRYVAARLIKVKKAAAPPKASVKPKANRTKAPAASSDALAPGAAPGQGLYETVVFCRRLSY
jgi:hypothetical protein